VDYQLLIGNCYVKQPGRGEFSIHQNWNLTDRPADTTVTIWAPLQPYDPANGSLMVVPGSHKLTRDIAHPRGGHYFSGFVDRVVRDHCVPVPVEPGEAVLFDDSLLHGSRGNESDHVRAALQVEAIPAESRPAVYLQRDDGDFDVIDGSARFYLETTQAEIDRWTDQFEVFRTEPNRNRALTEDQFVDLLERGSQVREELWGMSA
ncbi:MAG: phytanoyl-CoA dioxygenase family protein, partial [Actinomycetota bacterium]